jgi:hypothetical protein
LTEHGDEIGGGTVEEFAARVRRDHLAWRPRPSKDGDRDRGHGPLPSRMDRPSRSAGRRGSRSAIVFSAAVLPSRRCQRVSRRTTSTAGRLVAAPIAAGVVMPRSSRWVLML